MSNNSKRLRIGLLWHSLRSGNLGVGALTLANIAILRSVAERLGVELDLTVLTMREGYTDPIADGVAQFEIDTRSLLGPSGYRAAVKDLDCIIDIGAGDSFAEIYGPKRFAFMWLSKMIARSVGVPVVLAPQTIGPFTRQPYKLLAKIALNSAFATMARDEKSLKAARELAPNSTAHLSVDVAFKLPFTAPEKPQTGSPTKVGINASGLLCSQAETGENKFALSYDYLSLQRKLIEYWSAQDNVEIYLISHANSTNDAADDDGARADRLAAEYPNCHRVPDFAGPCEAKSFIASMDFLVAGRMHACIAAFSSGVPVVPVAYSRKFEGLFGLLDYSAVTPMDNVTTDQVFDFIVSGYEDRTRLSEQMRAGMSKIDALISSYESVLEEQFKALSTQ